MKKLLFFVFGLSIGLMSYHNYGANMQPVYPLEDFYASPKIIEKEVCPDSLTNQAFIEVVKSVEREVDYEPNFSTCVETHDLFPKKYQKTEADFKYLFNNGYEQGENDGYEEAIELGKNSYEEGFENCKKYK